MTVTLVNKIQKSQRLILKNLVLNPENRFKRMAFAVVILYVIRENNLMTRMII